MPVLSDFLEGRVPEEEGNMFHAGPGRPPELAGEEHKHWCSSCQAWWRHEAPCDEETLSSPNSPGADWGDRRCPGCEDPGAAARGERE